MEKYIFEGEKCITFVIKEHKNTSVKLLAICEKHNILLLIMIMNMIMIFFCSKKKIFLLYL